jgi:hypothetical protein
LLDAIHAKDFGATGNGTTDDTAAIQDWINACASANQVCFLDAGAYNLTSTVSSSANGLNIQCSGNQTAQFIFTTTAALQFFGNNLTFSNCGLIGPGTGTTSSGAPFVTSGSGLVFSNNLVTSFGTSVNFGTVVALNGNNGIYYGNYIINNVGVGIFIANSLGPNNMSGWIAENNRVTNGIIVHNQALNSNIENVIISNNNIDAGFSGNIEYCVEVGNFFTSATTSSFTSNVTVSGNTCLLDANGADGGYSIGGVQGFSVAGNTFNSNGFTYTIMGIEISSNGEIPTPALTQNGTVSGNTIIGGTGGSGIDCGACSNVSFTGNTVVGFGPNGFANFGMGTIVEVLNSFNSLNVSYTGNTIIFTSGGVGTGIFIQSNSSGHGINGTTVVGNTIVSDGTAGSKGIWLNFPAGSELQNTTLGPNTISSPATGILIDAGVTNTCFAGGLINSPTPITNNGSANSCPVAFSGITGQAALAQLPTIGADTVLGSLTGGTPIALTQTQLTALINPATASLPGIVEPDDTTLQVSDGVISVKAVPTTDLTGTLQAAQVPAFIGDATNTAGNLALTVGKIGGHAVSFSESLTITGTGGLTIAGPSSASTLTTPPASDTLAGLAAAQTFTGVHLLTGDTTSATSPGTGLNNETVIGSASAIALTSGTAKTITSAALTAGHWRCWEETTFNLASSSTAISFATGLGTVTNTFGFGTAMQQQIGISTNGPGSAFMSTAPQLFDLTSPTTIFSVAEAFLSAGSGATANSTIACERRW